MSEVAATVHSPGGLGANGFEQGLRLAGNYTFETTAPVGIPAIFTQPFYMIGQYGSNVVSLDFSVGTYAPGLQTEGSNGSIVTTGAQASYGFSHQVAGERVNGLSPFSFRMRLFDPTGKALNNLDLPGAQPPNLAAFHSRQWTLAFINGATVGGTVDTLTPVPLPASILFFGTGVSALIGFRFRQGTL